VFVGAGEGVEVTVGLGVRVASDATVGQGVLVGASVFPDGRSATGVLVVVAVGVFVAVAR
jgi:hypothetical protein